MPVDDVTIWPDCPDQRKIIMPQEVLRQCRRTPVVQDLHLTAIGVYPKAVGHYVSHPRGVPEASLIHCRRGRGWCGLGGRRWTVAEGQVLVIPPGQPHEYGADPEVPWAICWVHFTGRRVHAYLDLLGISAQQPILHLPETLELLHAFEELYGMLSLGYTEASLVALSTELGRFLGLLKVYQQPVHARQRQAEEKILESMTHMRENLHQSLRLAELAARVHMSVPHYCAMFKRHANASPILYHIRMRMQRACELLTGTDLSVAAVGQSVGYEDPYYFCRVFKQTLGQSPSSYRHSATLREYSN